MRKSLISLLLLTACSTGRLPWSKGISSEDARDSVYQVEVEVTLDTTVIDGPTKKGGDKGSSKFLLTAPAELATGARMLGRANDHTARIGWVGTGWVADRRAGRSFVMTAGHVCETGTSYHVEYMDWSTFSFVEADLPIISAKHVLVSRDGIRTAPVTVIRDEDLDEQTFNGNDLCLMGTVGDLGQPIPVADSEPDYSQTCDVIGGPHGLWGGGIAPTSEMRFNGRGSVFGTEPDGLSFTGIVAPGNSGSGVMCDGQAVGVISLGATSMPGLIHAVPYDSIRTFLKKALHRKA